MSDPDRDAEPAPPERLVPVRPELAATALPELLGDRPVLVFHRRITLARLIAFGKRPTADLRPDDSRA
jgi:hypothetical protein